MRISVVIPSFNQGLFLERTIESILHQGVPDLELIIIDGASTDNSVDVIRQYSDRIAYWVSEPDRGQTEALNKGVQRVTGDIWAYLCSDDTYSSGALTAVLKAFETRDVDVVYGDCHFINADDAVTRTKTPGSFDRGRLLRGNYLYQPSVFMRRWILDHYGPLDAALHYAMDYEYWLRISAKAKFYYLPEVLSNYRLHARSKSIHSILKQQRESRLVQKRFGRGIGADIDYYRFAFYGKRIYQMKRRFFDFLLKAHS